MAPASRDPSRPGAPDGQPAEVQRLTLRPGDRIVVRCPQRLSIEDRMHLEVRARLDLNLNPLTGLLVLDGGAAITALGESTDAEAEFLAASVAVWREIDRLDSRPEGYHPTAMDVELRQKERAAWERYRDTLPAEGSP